MLDKAADDFIENRTFDELTLGETASLSHSVTQRDIDLFAVVTGDVNPAHVDPAYAETDMPPYRHPRHVGGGVDLRCARHQAARAGDNLSRPGSHFRHPVSIGDTITATVTVREKKPEKNDVTLD